MKVTQRRRFDWAVEKSVGAIPKVLDSSSLLLVNRSHFAQVMVRLLKVHPSMVPLPMKAQSSKKEHWSRSW